VRSTNTFRALFPTIALIAVLNAPHIYAQAFIRDSNGCAIWNGNPQPKPGTTVSWSGACRGGFAQGSGILEWFVNEVRVEKEDTQFKDGREVGQSHVTFPNGSQMQADFQDGNRVHLKIQFLDGTHAEWFFPDGGQIGQGTIIWATGGQYSGSFIDGQLSGQGKLTYPNGNIYTGTVKSGKPDGQGNLVHTNGIREVGTFSNGSAVRVNVYNEMGVLIGSPDGDPIATAIERNSPPPPSQGADPQVCAQFLEGIKNNCPHAARGGPPAIYCGTSRSMYISSGCDQSVLGNDVDSAGLKINTQSSAENSAYTRPSSSGATSAISNGEQPRFEPGLRKCVSMVRNPNPVVSAYVFVNNCNVAVTVKWFVGTEAPSRTDIAPGQSYPVTSFSHATNVDFGVCRQGLGVFDASGNRNWEKANTPYTCRILQ
jgi:hypothetical protein